MALFMELDLGTMVVMRTSPTQSWGNLVERVISVLNHAKEEMKGGTLAKEEMSNEMEEIFKKCNGMGEVKLAAKAHDEREVVGPPLVVDEDAHEEQGQRHLMMHQQEYDCDEELLSMLVQGNPYHKEEEEHLLLQGTYGPIPTLSTRDGCPMAICKTMIKRVIAYICFI